MTSALQWPTLILLGPLPRQNWERSPLFQRRWKSKFRVKNGSEVWGRMFSIAPSLMCANLLQLESQIHELEREGARLFHIDIMDGHFVPNLGLNFDLVKQVQSITDIELDVHLMVDEPEQYIERILALKVSRVSFHIEAVRTPIRLAKAIKAGGTKVGIAINPATPVEALRHVLDDCDYVLIMTVEPGFAGQKFIPSMYEKIRAVR